MIMKNTAEFDVKFKHLPEPELAKARHYPGQPSMWFFVIGDLLIFGVYFVAYMAYRNQDLNLFLQSQQHMNRELGGANTLLLLTSSLFVALGTESARSGRNSVGVRFFFIAFLLGSLFPLIKFFEWIPKIDSGHTPGENLFFMFYYIMTGLHLVHVVLGLVIMGFVIRNLRADIGQVDIKFIESGATYWHMVDVLWLILFALFYLLR